MTEPNMPVTEDELHALVDNELPADRRAAVENWLETHPDDAARVAAWRAIGDAMHARYDAVADEAIPKRLELDQLASRPRRWMIGAAAAVLLAFAAGGGVGWFAHEASAARSRPAADPVDAMREEAFAAHRLYIGEVRHPIEVRAEENHLLPWLSRRIGMTLRAPDLSKFDLKLLGGRLLARHRRAGGAVDVRERSRRAGDAVRNAAEGAADLVPLSGGRQVRLDPLGGGQLRLGGLRPRRNKPRLKGIAMAAIEQSERR